mmetsp:Transcript_35396/g.105734  ORF Transcript_35396/g.105734 Transcript_35396/m.105734 type:complete len:381 (-) Transcript_35396:71-1213(-)
MMIQARRWKLLFALSPFWPTASVAAAFVPGRAGPKPTAAWLSPVPTTTPSADRRLVATSPRRRPDRFGGGGVVLRLGADDEGATATASGEGGTVLELTHPATGQLVTLIGTAHLSQKSNEQVTDMIETVRPDVVMIELDEARLERIGLTPEEMILPYATADDIMPPPTEDDIAFDADRPWWNFAREAFLDGLTRVGRAGLTAMYDDMSSGLGDDVVGGGEFLAAIRTAEKVAGTTPERTKIVLGDRDSLLTLRRAADLALRSGDPLGVMGRLSEANGEEMEELEAKVREGMPSDAAEAEVTAALIERIKADDDFRNRVFGRLEKEVPEFTQAFLTERDYIMAEAIHRERGAKKVVAVLGLAHLPGVAENLRKCFREEDRR